MTAKRDSKRKPKKDERPRLKKETVRDLDPEKKGEGVKGGRPIICPYTHQASCHYHG